ncbi:hypothetical protein LXA43DRAFT_877018 [Ganoderma leucocontextum]|nr:hypothetical protein LXA43DRAFT_877018 [Ganoderma leucocontextum]
MAFAPKPGCPMCSIVSAGTSSALGTPHSTSNAAKQHEILWRDENFTVYRETAYPVSSKGHIIVVFNLHVPSIYTLSSSDLPILVTLRDVSHRLLSSLQVQSTPLSSPAAQPQHPLTSASRLRSTRETFRIGFITPPFRDNKIPVTDHLHAHGYVLPADLMGWWRAVGYSAMAWYDIDDLIAEIREETSNNRVRSGMNPRPIDFVPGAGARRGTADGIETTDAPLGVVDADVEQGEAHPASPMLLPPTPTTARPRGSTLTTPTADAAIPRLQV